MQDFRLVLIIVGALAITALLVHGLWSNHKNKPKSLKDKPVPKVDKKQPQPNTETETGYDADGIGEVRVVSGSGAPISSPAPVAEQAPVNSVQNIALETEADDIPSFSAVDKADAQVQGPASREEQYSAAPAYQAQPSSVVPSQPVTSLEVEQPSIPAAQASVQATTEVEEEEQYITRSPAFKEPYFDEYGRQHYREPQPIKVKVKPAPVKVEPQPEPEPQGIQEPVAPQVEPVQVAANSNAQAQPLNTETQPSNTVAPAQTETHQVEAAPTQPQEAQASSAEAAPRQAEPQDVFVLNVMSGEGQLFAGAELLPTLLSLGFKFGEMDIFHRHLSPTGNGPVLFSMANMVKPGTFDVDHMEQFETHGVSLFMALPCAGDASNNFALMLHAAEMLASELNGAVFDATRQPLTRQKVNEYKQRIHDFERQNALVN